MDLCLVSSIWQWFQCTGQLGCLCQNSIHNTQETIGQVENQNLIVISVHNLRGSTYNSLFNSGLILFIIDKVVYLIHFLLLSHSFDGLHTSKPPVSPNGCSDVYRVGHCYRSLVSFICSGTVVGVVLPVYSNSQPTTLEAFPLLIHVPVNFSFFFPSLLRTTTHGISVAFVAPFAW